MATITKAGCSPFDPRVDTERSKQRKRSWLRLGCSPFDPRVDTESSKREAKSEKQKAGIRLFVSHSLSGSSLDPRMNTKGRDSVCCLLSSPAFALTYSSPAL